jgi:hypothetical protein
MSLHQREAGDAGSENIVNKAVDVFLSATPIALGNPADKLLEVEKAKYANLEVAPRIAHKLAIAAGEVIPILSKVNSAEWKSPSLRPPEERSSNLAPNNKSSDRP